MKILKMMMVILAMPRLHHQMVWLKIRIDRVAGENMTRMVNSMKNGDLIKVDRKLREVTVHGTTFIWTVKNDGILSTEE